MAYNPNLPAGQAAAASSAPVALATEDIADTYITGAASQSTLGNNVMLASAGTGSIDCMPASGVAYKSFTCQIIVSSGTSAGQVTFEGSNDNVTFTPLAYFDDASYGAETLGTTGTFVASTNRFFSAKIGYRYLRARISTGVVGGTIQAFTRLSAADIARATVVSQSTAGFLLAKTTPATGSAYSAITTASTNAASIKASAGTLYEIALSNPTATAAYVKLYNKASSPTVGTDVPVVTIPVPANSYVGCPFTGIGKSFTTGIAIAVTGVITDADTTSAVAGVHIHGTYI